MLNRRKTNLFPIFLKTHLENNNSQKVLSVLFSLSQDRNFLKLSDVEILRALNEINKSSNNTSSYPSCLRFLRNEFLIHFNKQQKQENQIVKNLGGLYILGTERNDSRRIDNQLRGRCGRQGDPGISQFYLSLDDNLLRIFGQSKIQPFLESQMTDEIGLESNVLTRALDSAQEQVEERAYQQRKNLFDYDKIVNQHRQIIYFERNRLLKSKSTKKYLLVLAELFLTDMIFELKNNSSVTNQNLSILQYLFSSNLQIATIKNLIYRDAFDELKLYLWNEFWLTYEAKLNALAVYGDEVCKNLERTVMLLSLDQVWCEHLQELTLLREVVGWRSYGQKNPLYEYQREAFKIFVTKQTLFSQIFIHDFLKSSVL